MCAKGSSIYVFRVYAKEKGLGSFWVGVERRQGAWTKTSGPRLTPIDVNVTDWSGGDCLMADADADYQHKAVSCDESFTVGK